MPNLKVEIFFPEQESKDEFVEMLAWMQTCGADEARRPTVYFQDDRSQKNFKKLCESMKGES